MKKTFIYLSILLFVAGCGKKPFVEAKPFNDNAVVYTYVSSSSDMNDVSRNPCYEFKIEDRFIEHCAYSGEYIEISNIKPQKLNFTAIRNDIEKKNLFLDIKPNKSYFLKVTTSSDRFNQFEFEVVDKIIALQDMQYMNIANPKVSNEEISYLKFIDKKAEKTDYKTQQLKSKVDKIKEAYKLKEDGVLNDDEFEKLKAEILDAN